VAGHITATVKEAADFMTRYGYFLSCEEYGPSELVRQAGSRKRPASTPCGSSITTIRGRTQQGQSGFVWSVIGAISQATSLPVTTAVTCPLQRQHPAIVAQAE